MNAATGITYKRKLATAPATEPVTTAEAKTWLYITGTDHDTLVGNLVKTARQKIETDYDCALINQSWDIYLDEFPAANWMNEDGAIEPVLYPVSSVTSLKYIDTDGTLQTWTATNYTLENMLAMPARILKAYDVTYPDTRDIQNAVTIRIVAGFGAATSDVPEPIRTAILLMVKLWYDNPEDMRLAGMPWERSAKALLNNYFTWRI